MSVIYINFSEMPNEGAVKCGERGEIPVILSLRSRMTAGMTNSCSPLPVFVGGFREAAEKGETVKVIFQEVNDLPYHIQ